MSISAIGKFSLEGGIGVSFDPKKKDIEFFSFTTDSFGVGVPTIAGYIGGGIYPMANSSKDIEGKSSNVSVGIGKTGANITELTKWNKGTGGFISYGLSWPLYIDASLNNVNTEIIFSTKDQNFIIPLTKEMNNYMITPWYSGFYDMSK
ncbi:hypothetical protein [Fusobacterium necrophorum]|uniref:hypothetical protein n=1 Tax=Fusobacterium necrophorum TaxID=859 RepID=UPI003F9FA426